MGKTRNGKVTNKSELGRKLSALLELHGDNQARLAAAAKVDPGRLSEWLRGKREPTGEALLKLGNVAPYPMNLWFWRRAGIVLSKMLQAAETTLQKRGAAPTPGEVVRVPAVRETADGKEETLLLPLPAGFVPSAGSVQTMTVVRSRLYPFKIGDIVILDQSDNDAKTLRPFLGEWIAIERGSSIFIGTLVCRPGFPDSADFWEAALLAVSRARRGDATTEDDILPLTVRVGEWVAGFRLDVKGLGKDHVYRVADQIRDKAIENVTLDPDVRILGRVIGFLRPKGSR